MHTHAVNVCICADKNTICIIYWALFHQGKKTWGAGGHSVCDDLHFWAPLIPPPPLSTPLPIPQVRGEESEVKGEVMGCLSCRRSPRLAPQYRLRGEEPPPPPPPPRAHLAAPRRLIWRENKNVFISQGRRRTLELNYRVKTQRGSLGLTQPAARGCVRRAFSILSVSVSLSLFFALCLLHLYVPTRLYFGLIH